MEQNEKKAKKRSSLLALLDEIDEMFTEHGWEKPKRLEPDPNTHRIIVRMPIGGEQDSEKGQCTSNEKTGHDFPQNIEDYIQEVFSYLEDKYDVDEILDKIEKYECFSDDFESKCPIFLSAARVWCTDNKTSI